jgi:hypothetical protein
LPPDGGAVSRQCAVRKQAGWPWRLEAWHQLDSQQKARKSSSSVTAS